MDHSPPHKDEDDDVPPATQEEQTYALGMECQMHGDGNFMKKEYKMAKDNYVTASELFLAVAKQTTNTITRRTTKSKLEILLNKIAQCNKFLKSTIVPGKSSPTQKIQKLPSGDNDEEEKSVMPKPNSTAKPVITKANEELAAIIEQSVLTEAQKVSWDDLIGLETVKQKMEETIVYPLKNPKLFTGLLTPSKGILLYGPPGNGKTMVAKALSSQCGSSITFFNLSGGSLTSRYYGDSEKLVKLLFEYAVLRQPSVIFIDEIDSILGARGSGEHEVSRRLKTEFLVHFDGVGTKAEDRVLLVGATNRPFDLDEAVLRRFTTKIFLPLPNEFAREDMLKKQLGPMNKAIKEKELHEIALQTDGYSFADLKAVCQEAAFTALRSLGSKEIETISQKEAPPIELSHFSEAIKKVPRSVTVQTLESFAKWTMDNNKVK